MEAEGHDRINCSNNPVNLVDPLGLWSWWLGPSFVGAIGGGRNFGGGLAYDSGQGWGLFGSHGPSFGLAGSLGIESGFFSGSITGNTNVFTVGYAWASVGLIGSEDGWGIVFGANLGLPFELTYSNVNTFFKPFCEE